MATTARTRRPGSETRTEILRVALDLFTRQGFEGTSIRDIAAALGVTKSSLYYHFENKDAIVQALVETRRDELDDLLAWIDDQPRDQGLLQRSALRWVESTTPQRIQGLRFAQANRPVMHRLAQTGGDFRGLFDMIVERVVPEESPVEQRLRARMAFDTVSAALFAAQGTDASTDDVLAAAKDATIALTRP
ncbi:TetR/AcrR family transcriptional regulator [Curtobacterium sp. RRHDQ10]|uniref:TetR/AcrR family transcriptional regulator n=1 Tax=Curtobacterium phyllosphaerae TaxID=3413379 RepID=UPI003BEF8982